MKSTPSPMDRLWRLAQRDPNQVLVSIATFMTLNQGHRNEWTAHHFRYVESSATWFLFPSATFLPRRDRNSEAVCRVIMARLLFPYLLLMVSSISAMRYDSFSFFFSCLSLVCVPGFSLAGEYWWVLNCGVRSFFSLGSFADCKDVRRNSLGSRLCSDDFFNGMKCHFYEVFVLWFNVYILTDSALEMSLHLGSGKIVFWCDLIGNVWFYFDELETWLTDKKWWKKFSVLMVELITYIRR